MASIQSKHDFLMKGKVVSMFDVLGSFALLGLGRLNFRVNDIILSQTGRKSLLLLVLVASILLEMFELALGIANMPIT